MLFVAALVVLNNAVGHGLRDRWPRLRPALGYGLGGLSMLWFLERLPAI